MVFKNILTKNILTSKGFATTYALLSISLIGIISVIGYGSYYGVVKNTTDTNQRTLSSNLLSQSMYTLSTESADIDNDGFPEAPAMKTGVTPVPTGGGHIPDSSGSPKRDSWGTPIGYCSWDHGSINSSTDRITGSNPATMSNIVFAVISAGPDKIFNTTCSQLASGVVNGDDGARWINGNQVRQGVGGTVYFGDPVDNLTQLNSLSPSLLKDGELRVVRSDNSIYRWNSATSSWVTVSGGGSGVPTGYMILGLSPTPPTGYTFTGDTVEAGNPGYWTARTPMPTARRSLTSSVVNNKIYVIGGISSNRLATNEEYDPATDTWRARTPMPTARRSITSSVVNNRIYVIGGYDINALPTNEEYNPATDTWTTKAPMPTARHELTSSVVNNKIYVIGGISATSTLSTNEEYDPATDTWRARTPMPTARRALTSSVVNNRIYVIGGSTRGSAGGRTAANEEYDPATDTWTARTPMPTARSHLTSSVANNRIYVIGGYNDSVVIPTNEEYDPATDTWTAKAPMPMARGFLTSSAVNNRIYVIGGFNDSSLNNHSINEQYIPITNTIYYVHRKN